MTRRKDIGYVRRQTAATDRGESLLPARRRPKFKTKAERAIQDVLSEAAGRLGASVEVGEAWDARGNLEGF